jgi:hypothetical protein
MVVRKRKREAEDEDPSHLCYVCLENAPSGSASTIECHRCKFPVHAACLDQHVKHKGAGAMQCPQCGLQYEKKTIVKELILIFCFILVICTWVCFAMSCFARYEQEKESQRIRVVDLTKPASRFFHSHGGTGNLPVGDLLYAAPFTFAEGFVVSPSPAPAPVRHHYDYLVTKQGKFKLVPVDETEQ